MLQHLPSAQGPGVNTTIPQASHNYQYYIGVHVIGKGLNATTDIKMNRLFTHMKLHLRASATMATDGQIVPASLMIILLCLWNCSCDFIDIPCLCKGLTAALVSLAARETVDKRSIEYNMLSGEPNSWAASVDPTTCSITPA